MVPAVITNVIIGLGAYPQEGKALSFIFSITYQAGATLKILLHVVPITEKAIIFTFFLSDRLRHSFRSEIMEINALIYK